jgi:hypothetical protein
VFGPITAEAVDPDDWNKLATRSIAVRAARPTAHRRRNARLLDPELELVVSGVSSMAEHSGTQPR